MAYWYENQSLLKAEKDGYQKFGMELTRRNKSLDAVPLPSIRPTYIVSYSFDAERRFTAEVDFTFYLSKETMMRIAETLPEHLKMKAKEIITNAPKPKWRRLKCWNVYAHDFPGRGSSGAFGGSIKVYPLTNINQTFHHLITDHEKGRKYICQVSSAKIEKVNSYSAMCNVLGWFIVYLFWELTGIDIDREGGAKWRTVLF